MRKQRSRANALIIFSVVLAGCSGAAKENEVTSFEAPEASVPQPPADPTLGSITGHVVDDELVPIRGVRVALVETGTQTETDEAGRYSIDDVAPQTYRILFDHPAYTSLARRVEVRAGHVSVEDIVLAFPQTTKEAYQAVVPKTAFIDLDHGSRSLIYYFVGYLNNSQVNGLTCSVCQFVLYLEPNPLQVFTDVLWQKGPGYSGAGVNHQIYVYYTKNWTDSTSTSGMGEQVFTNNMDMDNRLSALWPEPNMKLLKDVDKLKLYTMGGLVSVNVQHRLQIWTTFAYGEELPLDYTARPPP